MSHDEILKIKNNNKRKQSQEIGNGGRETQSLVRGGGRAVHVASETQSYVGA